MAYFMINGIDFSDCVCGLKITNNSTYNAQTNAAGNTVIDYINTKRTLEVSFIALDSFRMFELGMELYNLECDITYMDALEDCPMEMHAILPSKTIEYYSLSAGNKRVKAFTLTFTEL